MKGYLIGIDIVVLGMFVTTIIVVAPKVVHSAKSEALSCVPTLVAQCPSQDFLRGYDHWKELREAIGTSTGKESVTVTEQRGDEFNGLTNRLENLVPKGYQWDENKRRFIPIPVSAQSPPTLPGK
jgi:hypothetical protein